MDNDGISEDYVDVESIYAELKKRSESRIGGPWILREDVLPPGLDQSSFTKKVAKPQVG